MDSVEDETTRLIRGVWRKIFLADTAEGRAIRFKGNIRQITKVDYGSTTTRPKGI